ncbi:MAG: putative cadmium-transporting ATPase [Syntrophus sp. PtaU1.Bin005]|jgi:Cd2+/Zn2+-exporting ATPase|uniref:heavy metal translocating P-type ATPase n=1 Tax=Syntrophus sp. (in: bacteria) TaxID=48412 RepID=UPI0009C8E533|nr:MAG: putative cadmium-transporting ATPase [Syntrophus sp. PtaB.Bin138]OPY83778.1 MAG: putative cadmium-transporting ATPase [Syntrophus sp. PtaU1.Bin005]
MRERCEEKKEWASSRTFQVTGLDCADCAAKLEKAVRRVPGVVSAAVAFPQGRLSVHLDEAGLEDEIILRKVRALGYDATAEERGAFEGRESTFRIFGLDCVDCAARLEKGIRGIPGVERADVDFSSSKAHVVHRGPVSDILATLERMGYPGRIDQPLKSREALPFWKTNIYILPTAVSLVMLMSGFISGIAGAPGGTATAFFAAGIALGGFLPLRNGISVLVNARELDMNVLMMTAVIGAAALRQFEEAATVVFLFSLGNALQGYTLDKTRNAIRSLMDLSPAEALIRRRGAETTLPLEEIRIGDVMIIRPGERIAMDGLVAAGVSTVNQAPITGESLPVEKAVGDEVFAGTINERGALEVHVTRSAGDNTLSRIIGMVERAQARRAPSQQLIEKFARFYTPAVLVGAFLVATLPTLVFGEPFSKWFYEAMAMLLVACPCALVISTPVSVVSAIGSAARRGVLIKGGAYLEEMGSLTVMAFDKTGTLTAGKPRVTDVLPAAGHSEEEILAIAAAIECRSEHPLGEAIYRNAREKGLSIPSMTDFDSVPGRGAVGTVDGTSYSIGNARFFLERGWDLEEMEKGIAGLQNEGKTVVILGEGASILGLIAVADVLRENSRQALEDLRKIGIRKTIMLTGDHESTARVVAAQAGVDEFRADLLPEDKMEAMNDLLARYRKVAMVGDGVNDAPAMAVSTVGIAMGTAGTDAALETADIALMADDLTKLSYAVELSRRTLRIIKQNIFAALVIKGAILLLVFPGWLTLWLAVVGDMGSSLLVTLNAMRLLRDGRREERR